jgi:thiamine-phosphate pyrophosphorylase
LRHDGAFGFYPVVPDVSWVRRLLPLGVRTIQLRFKGDATRIRAEVDEAVALGRAHGAQVVINDHWRLALELGARHVHLGQGDLDEADPVAIRQSGIGLGVSTHSHAELERALQWPVSHVALGPIYETTLKRMPYAPQGLARISVWKERVACPLVAIGGISLERAPSVLDAGADLVAVVSDVVNSPSPETRVESWLRLLEKRRAMVTA